MDVKVYEKAAELIENAPRLLKGDMVNEDGDCFCAMGAILKVAGRLEQYRDMLNARSIALRDDEFLPGDPAYTEWFRGLMTPLAKLIKGEEVSSGNEAFSEIYIWNDSHARSREEVVEKLRELALIGKIVKGIEQAKAGETVERPEFS